MTLTKSEEERVVEMLSEGKDTEAVAEWLHEHTYATYAEQINTVRYLLRRLNSNA